MRLIQSGHAPSTSIFAALTGYFIGLAVTGKYRWYQVAWIGVIVAAILHGFNDWSRINGHLTWILVTLVSGILFLGYAKVGSRQDLRRGEPDLPEFMLPHQAQPVQRAKPRHAEVPAAPAPREPAGSRRGRPWWEH